MTTKKDFWKIHDARQIESQEEFFEQLKESDRITKIAYMHNIMRGTDKLEYRRIKGKKFKRVSFSHTHISDINFQDCVFEDCLFIGTTIHSCEFHKCKFVRTNTYKISISDTYVDPRSFSKCLKPSEHGNIGVHLYQVILRNSREIKQIEFEPTAQFNFYRWKRYQYRYEMKNCVTTRFRRIFSKQFAMSFFGYFRLLIWEKVWGFGLRLRYYASTVVFVITLFTFLNYSLRDQLGLELKNEPISSWIEALYYTLVSFTTLGYGDIVPSTEIGQLFASGQSLLGFVLMALLVSMLFKKLFP